MINFGRYVLVFFLGFLTVAACLLIVYGDQVQPAPEVEAQVLFDDDLPTPSKITPPIGHFETRVFESGGSLWMEFKSSSGARWGYKL